MWGSWEASLCYCLLNVDDSPLFIFPETTRALCWVRVGPESPPHHTPLMSRTYLPLASHLPPEIMEKNEPDLGCSTALGLHLWCMTNEGLESLSNCHGNIG